MGTGSRIDLEVRSIELELAVTPADELSALVLGEANLVRAEFERLRRVGRIEDELDHLPVGFVQIVPVVEEIPEPILEIELALSLVDGDVRIRRGLEPKPRNVVLEVALVEASGTVRIVGEIDIGSGASGGKIGGCKALGDDRIVGHAAPGVSTQMDVRVAENPVDRGGEIALALLVAKAILIAQHGDGCIRIGQLLQHGVDCLGRGRNGNGRQR